MKVRRDDCGEKIISGKLGHVYENGDDRSAFYSQRHGRLFITARSRIAEDALSVAAERGVLQIVILGAGLDSFALRSFHDARPIRIYELDYPATQPSKRQRVAEAQLKRCRVLLG